MSLVAHWKFENDTTDSIGSNDGSGSPNYVGGKLGRGIDGDGSTINVDISGGIKSALNGNHMTFSMWWRQYDNNSYRWSDAIQLNGTRLERGRGDDGNQEADYWCNFGSGDGNQLYDSAVNGVDGTEWFHIVVRRNGDDYEVWINGELNSQGTRTEPMEHSGTFEINYAAHGAEMDDVRLYDHAISEKEIHQLSQAKVLHYKFNQDNYVSTVPDESGQGYNGTVVRSPVSTTDSAVGSKSMDTGPGSNAIVCDSPKLPDFSSPNELTISCWVKSNESSWNNTGTFVSRRNNNQFVLHPDSNTTNVDFYVNTVQQGWDNVSETINDIQQWNHYSLTFENGTLTGYVNGQSIGNRNVGNDLTSATGPVTIGRDDDGDTSYGNEKIDDVRLYASALSASEVQEIYEQRASIDSGGNLHGHELSEQVSSGLSLEAYSRGNNS